MNGKITKILEMGNTTVRKSPTFVPETFFTGYVFEIYRKRIIFE